MAIEEEPYGLMKSYFGIDRRTLFTFLALIAGALIVVTCIYVAVFGFDTWKTNMEQAGSLMIINAPAETGNGTAPGAQGPSPAAPAYTCPKCNRTIYVNGRGSVPAPTGVGL